jgi:hypothetical protein
MTKELNDFSNPPGSTRVGSGDLRERLNECSTRAFRVSATPAA